MPRTPRSDGKKKGTKVLERKAAEGPKSETVTEHPYHIITREETRPGRLRHEIDEQQLYEAAMTHASVAQLARIFGVNAQFLRMMYSDLIKEARAEKQQELLAAQFKAAINDRNPTMQIWLGKQYLGQRDNTRVEQTGPGGGPVQNDHVHRVVAYIPDNGRDGYGASQSLATAQQAAKLGPGGVAAVIDKGPGDIGSIPGDDDDE